LKGIPANTQILISLLGH